MSEGSVLKLTLELFAVVMLIAANAFFVASEFALVTVRRARIDQLAIKGHGLARCVQRALAVPEKYLAAAQLGVTMASLALGWIGEPAIARFIQPAFTSLPTSMRSFGEHSVAFAIAFVLITWLHIVLGEQVPKIVALQYAEAVALKTMKLTDLFMKVCSPFIGALNWSTNRILGALGLKRFSGHSMVHSPEELKMLVRASQEAGVLEEAEEQIVRRVLSFGALTARHVMVPRTTIAALHVNADTPVVIEKISKCSADVLPVYRNGLDDIVGIVNIRHLVAPITSDPDAFRLADYVQEIPTVLPHTSASNVLIQMRSTMTHHALVTDEYGGTAGFVTFDDLMDRIIGTAAGEADLKAVRMTTLADGSVFVDGFTLVADLNERFHLHIDERLYTTVGGYVLGRLGRQPEVGDKIDVEGHTLRVEVLDGRRVAWVCVSSTSSV